MLFYSTELLTQVPIAVWLPANRAKKLYRKRVFVLPGKKPTTRRTYVKSLSRHKIAKIITIMGVEPICNAKYVTPKGEGRHFLTKCLLRKPPLFVAYGYNKSYSACSSSAANFKMAFTSNAWVETWYTSPIMLSQRLS